MSLSLLEPVVWLFAVITAYVAVGAGVALGVTMWRVRGAASGICAAVFGLIALYVTARSAGLGAFEMFGVSLVWAFVSAALYRFSLKESMNWQAHKDGRETVRQTTLHLILLTGSLIFMIPFAWLIVTSLKEEKEMSKFPPVWIPTQQVTVSIGGKDCGLANTSYQGKTVEVAVTQEFDTGVRTVQILEPLALKGQSFQCKRADLTEIRHFAPVWKNYSDAVKFLPPETGHGLAFLINTIQVSALSIFGTLLASSMVAYSFSRLRWPGRDALFLVLLGTMMLPSAVTMMPVFLIFRWLGWVDTLKPLWVPAFFGAPFYIFLLRQFFLGIPTELEEAARIDGCSYYMIFWRIMLPQIKPALAAITILAFMSAWNDFRNPLIYISSPEKETLAYALQLYQTSHGGEPGLLMAASTMVMAPVLALFFFSQRYFIQGITLTGIKG